MNSCKVTCRLAIDAQLQLAALLYRHIGAADDGGFDAIGVVNMGQRVEVGRDQLKAVCAAAGGDEYELLTVRHAQLLADELGGGSAVGLVEVAAKVPFGRHRCWQAIGLAQVEYGRIAHHPNPIEPPLEGVVIASFRPLAPGAIGAVENVPQQEYQFGGGANGLPASPGWRAIPLAGRGGFLSTSTRSGLKFMAAARMDSDRQRTASAISVRKYFTARAPDSSRRRQGSLM